MHNPAHPGDILRELYMAPLGITINKAAEAMKVSRKHVSSIINGRAAVTADMALRLAAAFGTDAETWLNLQTQYDLSQGRAPKGIKVLVTRGTRRAGKQTTAKAKKAA
jgi:addiction module HigA family antidote